MSAAASICCLKCRVWGPPIGDGGSIGFPSLEDAPDQRFWGDLVNFGYIAPGFRAIGYRPWDLEVIQSFLERHRKHELTVYFEGEDYRSNDEDFDDTARPPQYTKARVFTPDPSGFVNAIYEVACEACGKSFRSGPERMRPFEPVVITAARAREFRDRVRDVDEMNFHRVSGLLACQEQEKLERFIARHARHRPVARLVNTESWVAAGVREPRLSLSWHLPATTAERCHPVGGGRWLYVVVKHADGWSVQALDERGHVGWEWETAGGYSTMALAPAHGLLLNSCRRVDQSSLEHELVCLDPDSGRFRWRRELPGWVFHWWPEEGQLATLQETHEGDRESRVTLFSIGKSTSATWEFVRRWTKERPGGLQWALASTSQSVFVLTEVPLEDVVELVCLDRTTGLERWALSIGQFGRRYTFDDAFDVVGNLVIVGVCGQVVAVEARSGKVRWHTAGVFGQRWIVEGKRVCGAMNMWPTRSNVAFSEPFVTSLDVRSGNVLFRTTPDDFAGTPPPLARFEGTPILLGREYVVPDAGGGRLWAFDAKTGKPRWMIRSENGPVGKRPVRWGDRMVVQGPAGISCYGPR